MMCVLVSTDEGHLLRKPGPDGEIVFGPTHSLGKLSRYTKDNRITIVDRCVETSATQKAPATKAGAEGVAL